MIRISFTFFYFLIVFNSLSIQIGGTTLLSSIKSVDVLLNVTSNWWHVNILHGNRDNGQVEDFDTLLKIILDFSHKSEADNCDNSLASFLYGLTKKQSWAIKMFDSIGKMGSGITNGNAIWVGDFNLCYTVVEDPSHSKNQTRIIPFHGKFFWANFAINITAETTVEPIPADFPTPLLKVGLCVPDTCSEGQIYTLLGFVTDIPKIKKLISLTQVIFIPENNNNIWNDSRAVTAVCVCIIFAIVIALGTAYDLYLTNTLCHPTIIEYDGISIKSTSCCSVNGHNDENAILYDTNQEVRFKKLQCLNLVGKIFAAFSLRKNANSLFRSKPREKNLRCLNGIKVLSMIWIILPQMYMIATTVADNTIEFQYLLKGMGYQVIIQSLLVNDTFFLLSGILVSYFYFKRHERNGGKDSWIRFYLHRYWRLTPLYILILFLINDNLIKYLGNGPFWPQDGFEGNNCKKNWWWNVLYITNLTPSKYMCMNQSWYLSNVMQFFILSPVILIPLRRCFPFACLIAGIILVSSWITSGVISYQYNIEAAIDIMKLAPGTKFYYEALDNYYNKPYCHVGPYLIGIFCGWYLQKTKFKTQLKKMYIIFGWILSAACNSSLIFGLLHASDYFSVEMTVIYNTFSRTAWAIGMSWIIFACSNGYGGFLNHILSCRFWQPLSRLTYSVYLTNVMLISFGFYNTDVPIHLSSTFMNLYTISIIVMCYFCAMLLSLAFEMPFAELEKLIIKDENETPVVPSVCRNGN